MSNYKVKGLLKGLRYISQIFDEDQKEPEMQIGNPTDVKHVAHIGWDGPAVSSPSWMNEFKATEGGPPSSSLDSNSANWISEDSSSIRGSRDRDRDLPELPKATRRHSSESMAGDSPTKEKHKQSRKSSKNSTAKDSSNHGKSSSERKKNRRKKSREGSKSQTDFPGKDTDYGSESGSVSKALNGDISDAATPSCLISYEDDHARNGFS